MSRNLRPLLLAILACLAIACSSDSVTSPETMTIVPRLSASNPVTRPMRVTCNVADTVRAFSFPILTLGIGGTCQITHLGRATMNASQTVNLVTGTIDNTTTYTAPNGDVLLTAFHSDAGENTFDGANATFEGDETYVGGTGRFANASGSSNLVGSAVLNLGTGLGTGQYTANGTITY